ncbi:diaminopimelate epimerase [Paenibacillus sp. Marseille-Q7038]
MKQEIDFIKFNPSQNMTVLVKTEHPYEEHAQIASKIMSYDNVYAEQVGFIKKPMKNNAVAHLQMAGGEFCGNACMALASYITSERGLQHNDLTEISLEVSGTDRLITCLVKRLSNVYHCQVSMPIPKQIEQRTIMFDNIDLDMVIVRYDEFIHIVIEVDEFNETMKRRAQSLARLLGLSLGDQLIGILLYKARTEELAPLIYIPQLDSLIWERGCGSGTASIGAYLVWKNKKEIVAQIQQPGGVITVVGHFKKEQLTNLTIEGTVGIVAQGKAFIDL